MEPKGERFTVRKRILSLIAVWTGLCLMLYACPARAGDTADQTGLTILDASYDAESGKLTVKWKNEGEKTAAWAELRVNPRNAEGGSVVIGDGDMAEIPEERRVLRITVPAESGKEASATVTAGGVYPDAAFLEIAFDRVVWEEQVPQEDGSAKTVRSSLDLPDSRLHWYSTAEKAYISEPEGDLYVPPETETPEEAAEIRLGFTVVPVTREIAEAYGFRHNGLLIYAVENGSVAETVGLLPGDLIFGADETFWDGELYILPLAVSKLAKGEAVTLWLERGSEEYALELEPDEAE